MKPSRTQSSLKIIAAEAGLAEGTVSRILKGTDPCAVDTRKCVLSIAKKHKYRPNMLVTGMQTGRTKSIGVMVPFVDEFYGQIIYGIHNQLVLSEHVPIVLCSYQSPAPLRGAQTHLPCARGCFTPGYLRCPHSGAFFSGFWLL
ncbi:MAG: LacI family DNA-binding transcriptional regulator [Kiritimatiellia bacterium]